MCMAISNNILKEAKLKTDLLINNNDFAFVTSESCFFIRDLVKFLEDNLQEAQNYKRILLLALVDSGIDLDKAPSDVQSFIDTTGILHLDELEVEKLRKISSAVFFN